MYSNRPGDIVLDHDVTSTDVLSGKGKGVAAREGNQFYSRLIKTNKDEYLARKTVKLKKEVARSVLMILKNQDPPARFMKGATGENNSQIWIIQDDKFANKKITQALREKRDKKREKQQEEAEGINIVSALAPAPEINSESDRRSSVKRSFIKVNDLIWNIFRILGHDI